MPVESLEGEVWKDVEGWVGLYQVSNKGRVKRVKRKTKVPTSKGNFYWRELDERLKTIRKCSIGYHRVQLTMGRRKNAGVHRLVCRAWHGNPPCEEKNNALHKNDIKTDNRPENLYWGTLKENQRDSKRNGGFNHARGEDSGGSKLNKEAVKLIRELHGEETISRLSKIFEVSRNQIIKIQQYKAWTHIE